MDEGDRLGQVEAKTATTWSQLRTLNVALGPRSN